MFVELWKSVADLYGRALPEGYRVNPYQVLGISDDASQEEIRAAYQSRAKKYHPDSGGDAWALQQVQAAYETLSPVQIKGTTSESPIPSPTPAESQGHNTRDWFLANVSRRREIAVAVAIGGALLTLVFWSLLWRIAAVVISIGFGAVSVWLLASGCTYNGNKRNWAIGGGVASAVLCILILWNAVFSRSQPSISSKSLRLAAPAIVVTLSEREFNGPAQMLGSGVVCQHTAHKLHVFTNSHVVGLELLAEAATHQPDRAANVTNFGVEVQFPSGKRRPAERIAIAADRDVACIELSSDGLIAGTDFVVIPRVSNAIQTLDVQHGDDVVAVGTPKHIEFANSVTYGRVSSLREFRGDPSKWIQHDASITGGNSGGPLFLARGDRAYWIGINTLAADTANLSMAISADDVVGAQLRWSNCSPTGAAELVEQVYGIAAASGEQRSKTVFVSWRKRDEAS